MGRSFFVTGIRGYVGRHLAPRLVALGAERIVALVREIPLGSTRQAGVDYVLGDLADPDSYCEALAGCDVVLHLAAITGKDLPHRYHETNAVGTRELVRASADAGVKRFLLVSTIAVTFPDQTRYFYAHSKVAAEEAVRSGGLPHAIVRPTMIFGPGAPVLDGLTKMAEAPIVPMFGRGRVEVQPVHVDDVVALLVEIVEEDRFADETIESGGPEVLTIEALLARIRKARSGRDPSVLHVPLRPVRFVLGLLEPLFLQFLPLTAGQLASFANDGTATASAATAALPVARRGLDDMLAAEERSPGVVELRAECHVFTRYLIGETASEYVVERYIAYHDSAAARGLDGPFDRVLLRVARRGPLFTRLVDSYISRLRRRSSVRFKLVALMALLECSPPSASSVDTPPRGGLTANILKLGVREAIDLIALAISVPLLLPFHLLLRGDRERTEERP